MYFYAGFCFSSLEDPLNERNITPSGHLPRFASFLLRILTFIQSILQGASILTGLGFAGLNAKGEPQWDGAANVKVMQIEFAPNFKLLLDAWNVKTNVWLRECVYKRVTPKGKKPGFKSSMITFFTSAFWVCGYFFCVFSRL
jgi:lysophospholipid acyltransferase